MRRVYKCIQQLSYYRVFSITPGSGPSILHIRQWLRRIEDLCIHGFPQASKLELLATKERHFRLVQLLGHIDVAIGTGTSLDQACQQGPAILRIREGHIVPT